MRPYTDKEGKTPKKRTRRGEKALSGVKKSLVKAKVSAVKTSRKLQNGNSDEVEDLLNSTANGATPKAKEVAAKVGRPSNAAKQMKKLKSLVKVESASTNGGVTPTRKSKRLSQKAEAKMDVVIRLLGCYKIFETVTLKYTNYQITPSKQLSCYLSKNILPLFGMKKIFQRIF